MMRALINRTEMELRNKTVPAGTIIHIIDYSLPVSPLLYNNFRIEKVSDDAKIGDTGY